MTTSRHSRPRHFIGLCLLILMVASGCDERPTGTGSGPSTSRASSPSFDLVGNSHGTYGVAAGESGKVWVTAPDEHKVGWFDETEGGGITWIAIDGQPLFPAIAPGQSAWFTDRGDSIWEIFPSGEAVATHHSTPKGAKPWGVAVTEDGTVWYAMRGNRSVGYLSPDGKTGEVSLAQGEPLGLAADGDTVWVVGDDIDSVIQLGADGLREKTPIPKDALPGLGAKDVAVGIGFQCASLPQVPGVLMVTSAGSKVVGVEGYPWAVTVQGDGCWVADLAGQSLTFVGTDGSTRSVQIPADYLPAQAAPLDIASAPNGDVFIATSEGLVRMNG